MIVQIYGTTLASTIFVRNIWYLAIVGHSAVYDMIRMLRCIGPDILFLKTKDKHFKNMSAQ